MNDSEVDSLVEVALFELTYNNPVLSEQELDLALERYLAKSEYIGGK